MNKPPLVAFDVDLTLLDKNKEPREDIIQILKLLSKYCKIMVWSGMGAGHADNVVEDLGLTEYVAFTDVKNNEDKPQIAFDDDLYFKQAEVMVRV